MATITTDSLPTDVSAYIQAELRTGKYQSAEELVTTALRERRDREQKLADLRAKIDAGLDDIQKGNVVEIGNEEEHRAFFESIKQRGRDAVNQRRLREGKPPLSID